MTITVSGGHLKTFDTGEEDEFFDYLMESPEASYMWRESADMIALTNFIQMEVEVNVYNSETKTVQSLDSRLSSTNLILSFHGVITMLIPLIATIMKR